MKHQGNAPADGASVPVGGGGASSHRGHARAAAGPGRPVAGTRRHARLSGFVLWAGLPLLAASLISGAGAWVGEVLNARMDTLEPGAGFPVRLWLTVHGALNPLVCVLFGYLLHQHMRIGWNQRVNHRSGALMFLIFAGLILTGAAHYYVAAETSRAVITWTHRSLGLALPAMLAVHWILALRWARTLPPPPTP